MPFLICTRCAGSGNVLVLCSVCNGSGEGHIAERPCNECGRSGRVVITCPVCAGLGEQLEDNEEEEEA